MGFRRTARCRVAFVTRPSNQATSALVSQVSEFERFAELAETMGVDGIRAVAVEIPRGGLWGSSHVLPAR